MEGIRISVITVCYNASVSIEKTIKSVVSQTYDNIEYIIVDGGSTDETVEIIKRYSKKISSYLSEKDNGIYDAMNKGVDISTGDYLIFLNAGDYFVDDKVLDKCSRSLSTGADYYYGDCICSHNYGLDYTKAAKLDRLKKEMTFSHQSVFISSYIMKNFKYDTSYRLAADYKLMLQGYTSNKKFGYINIPISVVEKDTGATASNFVDSKKEVCRIHKEIGYSYFYRKYIFYSLVFKGYLYSFIKNNMPSCIISFIKRGSKYDYSK